MAAIGFPVVIISLLPLRWILLPKIFTELELLVLDAPTDADVVLASMGGRAADVTGDGELGEGGGSGSSSENAQGMRSREGFKDEEEKEVEHERG
ncbi:hypothetical protein LTR74_018206 [Friedmanniomyces endolithicus]|nr:hypothetical protein LTR74_018206 [Friedmanniomyces endolithicus]